MPVLTVVNVEPILFQRVNDLAAWSFVPERLEILQNRTVHLHAVPPLSNLSGSKIFGRLVKGLLDQSASHCGHSARWSQISV